MSAIPDTTLGRRSIGEILLEHGYVTKEQVDEAVSVQAQTGRPLGQILVEAGTITRLELASALAEQWSDSGAPIAPPVGLSLSGTVPVARAVRRLPETGGSRGPRTSQPAWTLSRRRCVALTRVTVTASYAPPSMPSPSASMLLPRTTAPARPSRSCWPRSRSSRSG